MTKEQAYHDFWSQFEWKAYDSATVPDDAILPYITYEAATDSFENRLALNASLWDRSTSWATVTAKADEIAETITRGGTFVPYENGAICIHRATPWAQRMSDDDDGIRRIVLNLEVEFID